MSARRAALPSSNREVSVPRVSRVVRPDVPLHITQRGVDRCATFLSDEDHAFYLWALQRGSMEARCAVHAYVLMSNHVHLLLTPGEIDSPARLMRSLGARYVRYFNARYRRTGALWEGRYRSSVVDSAPYFFACSRYIELNPIRAGLVCEPGAYEWSSFRHNALGAEDARLEPHPIFRALAAGRESRCAAYRAMFSSELEPTVVSEIRAQHRGAAPLTVSAYQRLAETLPRDQLVGNWDATTPVQRGSNQVPGERTVHSSAH